MGSKNPELSIERRVFYLAISECKYVTDVALVSSELRNLSDNRKTH
jgi:hypothetical protein